VTVLSAAEITRVADDAFAADLACAGFSKQKPRYWIRTSKSPIHEIVYLYVFGSGGWGYGVDWGIGATFVPELNGYGTGPWKPKRKRTMRSSQIDFDLGPRRREIQDRQTFQARTVPIEEPTYKILGTFTRRIPLPALPKYLADEVGICAIVGNGCSAALKAFEPIRGPLDMLDLVSSGYEKTLSFPAKMMPSYWLKLGLYEIACGKEDEGQAHLKQASETFDIDLADPILQESISVARSHFRETVA